VVVFLAIAWAFYRVTAMPSYLVLGGLASVGSLFSLHFVLLLDSRSLDHSFHSKHGLLKKAADQLTNRDFSVILLLFTLVGRLDWFLWLAALGSNIFWTVLLWIYRKEARSLS
jgi:hypothetical protein